MLNYQRVPKRLPKRLKMPKNLEHLGKPEALYKENIIQVPSWKHFPASSRGLERLLLLTRRVHHHFPCLNGYFGSSKVTDKPLRLTQLDQLETMELLISWKLLM